MSCNEVVCSTVFFNCFTPTSNMSSSRLNSRFLNFICHRQPVSNKIGPSLLNKLSPLLCQLKTIGIQTPICCNSTMASVPPAKRLQGVDKNLWVEFSALAVKHEAVNLGQGFPDFPPPKHVVDALTSVTTDHHMLNQYTRAFGHPALVKNLSRLYSPIMGKDIDPMSDIIVTVGAYGSLFAIIQAYIEPGDELVIIEPFFDCYQPMTMYSGGTPKFVPLRPNYKDPTNRSSADWTLDPDELEAAFSDKTKAIIINTPNNPLGKVFRREELQMIADLCQKYDCICISDEVYEWLMYPGQQHVRIASLPGMWDRTVTIGSAGKTFSVTGWKLGWTIGPQHIIKNLGTVWQNACFNAPTPTQEAVARAFEHEISVLGTDESYFKQLPAELLAKKSRLAEILRDAGFDPIMPDGGYFMIADASNIDVGEMKLCDGEPWDYTFVKWMTANKKVATIPSSAFYSDANKHIAGKMIRFCFAKEDATIEKMADIFKQWKNSK